MRAYDLIMKKRNGGVLDAQEIQWLIRGYMDGSIQDYQMSAFLMAVYFQGMTKEETLAMTQAVADSGDRADLSAIEGIKIDKHSTGGVGDKTTLIVAPIVAACGVKVAKMSGRGLGHTGGTVDKLESIPGMQTSIPKERFFEIVNQTGVSVVGQSGSLAPADKKLYALRDVTATVDSIPLIAVSIMSKKLAAGSDGILLDVKMGSGAFMKTEEAAIELAKEMVDIGENAGKKTAALITNMDIPLGCMIGNSLEVTEAVHTLQGKGPEDLTEVCLCLAADMLVLAGKGSYEACRSMAEAAIQDGSALQKLIDLTEAQGGDSSMIRDPACFEQAAFSHQVLAEESGYITWMDTEGCGIASSLLGAGRETKESSIDYSAGIEVKKKTGDYVETGEVLAVLFANKEDLFPASEKKYKESIQIKEVCPEKQPLIYARITADNIERFC